MSAIRRLQQAKARRTAAVVAAAAASPLGAFTLRTPNDMALNSQMEEAVMNLRRQDHPTNTIKELDTKAEECMQFCDKVYPHDPTATRLSGKGLIDLCGVSHSVNRSL